MESKQSSTNKFLPTMLPTIKDNPTNAQRSSHHNTTIEKRRNSKDGTVLDPIQENMGLLGEKMQHMVTSTPEVTPLPSLESSTNVSRSGSRRSSLPSLRNRHGAQFELLHPSEHTPSSSTNGSPLRSPNVSQPGSRRSSLTSLRVSPSEHTPPSSKNGSPSRSPNVSQCSSRRSSSSSIGSRLPPIDDDDNDDDTKTPYLSPFSPSDILQSLNWSLKSVDSTISHSDTLHTLPIVPPSSSERTHHVFSPCGSPFPSTFDVHVPSSTTIILPSVSPSESSEATLSKALVRIDKATGECATLINGLYEDTSEPSLTSGGMPVYIKLDNPDVCLEYHAMMGEWHVKYVKCTNSKDVQYCLLASRPSQRLFDSRPKWYHSWRIRVKIDSSEDDLKTQHQVTINAVTTAAMRNESEREFAKSKATAEKELLQQQPQPRTWTTLTTVTKPDWRLCTLHCPTGDKPRHTMQRRRRWDVTCTECRHNSRTVYCCEECNYDLCGTCSKTILPLREAALEICGNQPIRIAGATGTNADFINGEYTPTKQLSGNVTVYDKDDVGKRWLLEYSAALTSWQVKTTENCDKDHCVAYCVVAAKCVPEECPVGEWQVAVDGEWGPQPGITIAVNHPDTSDSHTAASRRRSSVDSHVQPTLI